MCLKTSQVKCIPGKQVPLEGSCSDSPEAHSGTFSFRIVKDVPGWPPLRALQGLPCFLVGVSGLIGGNGKVMA